MTNFKYIVDAGQAGERIPWYFESFKDAVKFAEDFERYNIYQLIADENGVIANKR